jgi:hypothetical protein
MANANNCSMETPYIGRGDRSNFLNEPREVDRSFSQALENIICIEGPHGIPLENNVPASILSPTSHAFQGVHNAFDELSSGMRNMVVNNPGNTTQHSPQSCPVPILNPYTGENQEHEINQDKEHQNY